MKLRLTRPLKPHATTNLYDQNSTSGIVGWVNVLHCPPSVERILPRLLCSDWSYASEEAADNCGRNVEILYIFSLWQGSNLEEVLLVLSLEFYRNLTLSFCHIYLFSRHLLNFGPLTKIGLSSSATKKSPFQALTVTFKILRHLS